MEEGRRGSILCWHTIEKEFKESSAEKIFNPTTPPPYISTVREYIQNIQQYRQYIGSIQNKVHYLVFRVQTDPRKIFGNRRVTVLYVLKVRVFIINGKILGSYTTVGRTSRYHPCNNWFKRQLPFYNCMNIINSV